MRLDECTILLRESFAGIQSLIFPVIVSSYTSMNIVGIFIIILFNCLVWCKSKIMSSLVVLFL